MNTRQINLKSKNICRVGLYARFSSDNQSPVSADDQIRRIQYRVENNQVIFTKFPLAEYKIKIIDECIFKDEAMSGKVGSRVGYEALLNGIRQRKFDAVIVDDLSRLTRDLGTQVNLHKLLKFNNIELISVCDGISSEQPNSMINFTFKGMANQMASEDLAHRTKRGQEIRVLDGFSSGDVCYGYNSIPTRTRPKGGIEIPSHYKLEVNLEEAAVVRMIFELRIKGLGFSSMAKLLNKRNIPSPRRGRARTGRVCNWSLTTVRKILTREKYIGIWEWGKTTRILNPDTDRYEKRQQPRNLWVKHHQGKDIRQDLVIIDIETWVKVQKTIQIRERFKKEDDTDSFSYARASKVIGSKSESLLAGILKCSECGSNMLQITGRRGGYYGCFTHHRKSKEVCKNKFLIHRLKLERFVVDKVKEILLSEQNIQLAVNIINKKINQRLRSVPIEISQLQQRRNEIQRKVRNLMHFIEQGDGSAELVKENLGEREVELRYTEEQIRLLQVAESDKVLVTVFSIRRHFENLTELFEKDPALANAALRKLFLNGLVCIQQSRTEKKNLNQNNSKWMVMGAMDMSQPMAQHYSSSADPIPVNLEFGF